MTTPSPHDIVEGWRASAPYWEKHGEIIRLAFSPITSALLDATAISAGQSVLDVAGGMGEPAMTIAETVGLDGRVVCTDIAPGMVAAARREAMRRGFSHLGFALCSADDLPFAAEAFDTAVSRLGIMFFPDPLKAISEMARVVRPGGRIGFAVWGTKDENPFFRVPTEVINTYVESTPEGPDAPGAWRFGDSGLLAGMLAETGIIDITEARIDFTIAADIDFAGFWTMRVELSDTLRQKMGSLSPTEAAAATDDVRRATVPFFPNGKMRFPASVLAVSGRVAEG